MSEHDFEQEFLELQMEGVEAARLPLAELVGEMLEGAVHQEHHVLAALATVTAHLGVHLSDRDQFINILGSMLGAYDGQVAYLAVRQQGGIN